MSEAEFYEILQKGDIVDAQQSFEEHQEMIGQQGPSRPEMESPQQSGIAA